MFTIKLYSDLGHRQRILTAESFTILRVSDGVEITLHQKCMHDDSRVDIKQPWPEAHTSDEQQAQWPERHQRAIIENELGKTTEIIACDAPQAPPRHRDANAPNSLAA